VRKSRTFPARPDSAPAARRFLRTVMGETAPELIEPLELMVSELASNCIKHAHSAFKLTIIVSSQAIRVEVTDSCAESPTLRSPGPEDVSGRGLRIVDLLSDRWGVRHSSCEKTVWFSIGSTRSAGTSKAAPTRSEGCCEAQRR
jgi:anti-sigma regulatory factor (Ser/Thr protein kinase)